MNASLVLLLTIDNAILYKTCSKKVRACVSWLKLFQNVPHIADKDDSIPYISYHGID